MRRGGELSPADLGREALHRDAVLLSGSGQLCNCVREGIADAACQALHCNDTAQADQHDEQTVLDQILAFFFLPQLYEHTLHSYPPFYVTHPVKHITHSAPYRALKVSIHSHSQSSNI